MIRSLFLPSLLITEEEVQSIRNSGGPKLSSHSPTYSGIAKNDVEPAEVFDRGSDQTLYLVGPADIDRMRTASG